MSIYTGISVTTLTARLTEAQDAYHALSLGKQTVSLSLGDKRLTFTPADTRRLASYIAQLQREIDIANGNATGSGLYSTAVWTR
jgi:hypothetical protein